MQGTWPEQSPPARSQEETPSRSSIDISNPLNADASGLAAVRSVSAAEAVAQTAPSSARVIKAFNTIFGHVSDKAHPVDVLFAGDTAQGKRSVSTFIESLGLHLIDVGCLNMAHWLGGAGLLLVGAANNGAEAFNIGFGVTEFE